MMQDFGTTVLVSTPTYALYLAEQGIEAGVDFSALPLRLGLFGGEPCSDKLKPRSGQARHSRDRQLRALRGHGAGRLRRM
jgi:phenylacetate-CoA ligase